MKMRVYFYPDEWKSKARIARGDLRRSFSEGI